MNSHLNSQSSQYTKRILIEKQKVIDIQEYIKAIDIQNIDKNLIKNDMKKLGPCVFYFQIQSDSQEWIIRKQMQQILDLNQFFKSYFVEDQMEQDFNLVKSSFPDISMEIQNENISDENKLGIIERYFQYIVQINNLLQLQEVQQFFEISAHEYQENITKYKEFFAYKKKGGRQSENCCKMGCVCICSAFMWNKRYFQITSEGIQFSKGSKPSEVKLRESLLFDQQFNVEYDRQENISQRRIILKYSQRRLQITALNIYDFYDILYAISKASGVSLYTNLQRHNSFAPVREKGYCKMYIDGEGYFSDVCDSLLGATSEVFIAGWWVSPQLYLKRPIGVALNQDTRLDKVLLEIAKRGVLVRIIIWNAPTIALTIDSQYTQKYLMSLHDNIIVIRHPQYILPTFLWSHHEKMVVVDQHIGYLGGLDLCYGRMDNHQHRLAECHDEQFDILRFWPGIDYSNSRIKDFVNVTQINQNSIDPLTQPRLPWHDIAIQIRGEAVRDLSRHFVQYWNFSKMDITNKMAKHQLINVNNNASLIDRKGKEVINKFKQFGKKFKGFFEKHFNNQNNNNENYDDIEKLEQVDTSMKSIQFTNTKEIEAGQSKVQQPTYTRMKRKTLVGKDLNDYIQQQVANTQCHIQVQGDQQSLGGGGEEEDIQIQRCSNSSLKQLSLPRHYSSHKKLSQQQTKNNILSHSHYQLDKLLSQDHFENQSELPNYYAQIIDENNLQKDQKIQFLNLLNEMNKKNELNEDLNYMEKNDIYENKKKTKRFKIMKKMKTIFGNFKQDLQNDKINKHQYRLSLKVNKQRMNKVQQQQSRDESFLGISKSNCRCQLLRSASEWSIGLEKNKEEKSIQIAYLQYISSAEHFIYIENQFLISSVAGKTVKNQICQAIVDRIKLAAKNEKKFRVVIVMPLLPGFEGEIQSSGAGVMKAQLGWEYKTISRNTNSIYSQLEADPHIKKVEDYLQIFGLRTHQKIGNIGKTEQIYVHSKMMVVDDQVAIIGSANINDRSQIGNRDSEIAIVVEQEGNERVVKDLRVALWQEHFGLTREQLLDPMDDHLFTLIREQANRNNDVYRQVFGCYPDDYMKTLSDIDQIKAASDITLYDQLKKEIKGNAVTFPSSFLLKDNLAFRILSDIEYILPDISFT